MEKFPTFKQGDSPKKLLEHTLLNNMFSALEGQVTRTLGVDSIRAGNSDYTPIPGGPTEVRLVRVVDYEPFSGSETFSAPLGEVNVIQCELTDALFAEEVGTQEVSQQSAKPNVIYAAAPPSFTTEVNAFIWVAKFSGQWWVLTGGGGGTVNIRHGIIRSICDATCNIYEVELINRSFDEACGTGTGTGSA